MAFDSFEKYSSLTGERAYLGGIPEACETLDALSCSDFLTLMTIMSETRSKDVDLSSVLIGNRFHEPSTVPQRRFHQIEEEIFTALPSTNFVELSTLQPFGINAVLAGTNEKNVVAALRRSEVNADATTALFRLALNDFTARKEGSDTVHLASNVRTTRAQVFSADTKFLPHFKVFAQVSVGRQGVVYGQRELETLANHMAVEVGILERVAKLPGANIDKIHVAIGNVLLAKSLINTGVVDERKVRQNTTNPQYNILDEAGLDIPKELPMDIENIVEALHDFGIQRGARVIGNFQTILRKHHPELLPSLKLDLSRIAGIGYYSHMAYKITAENIAGQTLPLADGGTTNWARTCTNDKRIFSVSTGIGTELLGSYFFDNVNT